MRAKSDVLGAGRSGCSGLPGACLVTVLLLVGACGALGESDSRLSAPAAKGERVAPPPANFITVRDDGDGFAVEFRNGRDLATVVVGNSGSELYSVTCEAEVSVWGVGSDGKVSRKQRGTNGILGYCRVGKDQLRASDVAAGERDLVRTLALAAFVTLNTSNDIEDHLVMSAETAGASIFDHVVLPAEWQARLGKNLADWVKDPLRYVAEIEAIAWYATASAIALGAQGSSAAAMADAGWVERIVAGAGFLVKYYVCARRATIAAQICAPFDPRFPTAFASCKNYLNQTFDVACNSAGIVTPNQIAIDGKVIAPTWCERGGAQAAKSCAAGYGSDTACAAFGQWWRERCIAAWEQRCRLYGDRPPKDNARASCRGANDDGCVAQLHRRGLYDPLGYPERDLCGVPFGACQSKVEQTELPDWPVGIE
ncbi:MAG: hypothetical protein H6707_14835 [Deltaproteobacteria bacterium]|nr:hypothetical protein [Deltaproteobacteria bacterium]